MDGYLSEKRKTLIGQYPLLSRDSEWMRIQMEKAKVNRQTDIASKLQQFPTTNAAKVCCCAVQAAHDSQLLQNLCVGHQEAKIGISCCCSAVFLPLTPRHSQEIDGATHGVN